MKPYCAGSCRLHTSHSSSPVDGFRHHQLAQISTHLKRTDSSRYHATKGGHNRYHPKPFNFQEILKIMESHVVPYPHQTHVVENKTVPMKHVQTLNISLWAFLLKWTSPTGSKFLVCFVCCRSWWDNNDNMQSMMSTCVNINIPFLGKLIINSTVHIHINSCHGI